MLAKADNRDVTDIEASATVGGTGTSQGYTVPALSAAQADALHVNSLLWADGFPLSANNGLKVVVTTDPDTADTSLRVAGLTAGSDDGFVSLAGYRVPGGTSKQWAWNSSSKVATLTVTGLGSTLEDGGLAVGQMVHIGSIAYVSADELQNGVVDGAVTRYGYARVKSFAANVITFDRVSLNLQDSQSAADTTNALDVVFGRFIRNVSTADSRYFQQTLAIELESPDLADGTLVNGAKSTGDSLDVDDGSIFSVGDAIEVEGAYYRVSGISTNDLTIEPDIGSDADHPAIADNVAVRPVNDFEYSVGNLINSLTLNLPLTEKATMAVELIGQDTKAAAQQNGRQGGTGASAGQPRTGGHRAAPHGAVQHVGRLRPPARDRNRRGRADDRLQERDADDREQRLGGEGARLPRQPLREPRQPRSHVLGPSRLQLGRRTEGDPRQPDARRRHDPEERRRCDRDRSAGGDRSAAAGGNFRSTRPF